jgi:proton glutamate symport protein
MKLSLHWQIMIALLFGVIFALLGKQFGFEEFIINKVAVIGDIFLRLLRMVIVPLIIASIVTGITSIGNGANLGRMGLKTVIYYTFTTIAATSIGLWVVGIIEPGVGANLQMARYDGVTDINVAKFGSDILSFIPTNPLAAMVEGAMLPIIFFSLVLGIFITKINEKHSATLSNAFDALFEVMMAITNFVIKITPIAVFALIAKAVASTGMEIFEHLGIYFITVVIALLLHALVVMPLLLFLVARVNPLAHLKAMSTALLTAFSTASSLATLPVTIRCVEDNAGVSNKTSSFVLPLGATVNMDGTALYQCVAVLFIAQLIGMDLSLGHQLMIIGLALTASVGAAGIPGAGMITMGVIMTAVGLPLEYIALILPVDRLLDMLRTGVNVWSDSCGAVIIAKTEKEQLNIDLT